MKTKSSFLGYILTSSALLSISYAHARTLHWDGNDTTANADGGAGIWNASNNNWDTAARAGSDATWNNTPPDLAVFGGTASSSVALGSTINVGGLQFNTTGYGITTTGQTLNFAAANNNIVFNGIAVASITGSIGGSGNVILSRTNISTAGTLSLAGTASGGWSGTTTIDTGTTLGLAASNQALKDTSAISLNGGTISLTQSSGGSNDLVSI